MNYRHELKQEISPVDMLSLRQRLTAVMHRDAHTLNGKYEIRSLYFDNLNDKALREKLDGVNFREKFRIRCYNGDASFIRLEKKSKINGMCLKQSTALTPEQTLSILNGSCAFMAESREPLLREFYLKQKHQGLRPKTIVDYTREPFVFAPGNVRVTLDHNIKTALSCTSFLDNSCVTIPIKDNPIILEIKWDDYLPDIIKSAVRLEGGRLGAFSKYAACRMYD